MIRQQTYEDGTLTTLLFDGGYVSLDFIRPFLAMSKLKQLRFGHLAYRKRSRRRGREAMPPIRRLIIST